MQLDAPFRLGGFLVDRDGKLQPGSPEATPTLYLDWHGLSLCVRLTEVSERAVRGRLSLSAVVGRVPSTVNKSAHAAGDRERVLARIQGLSAAIGKGWRLALMPDHRARIEVSREIVLPTGASGLLAEVTCLLLDLAPYLDLLVESELGMEPAGAPSCAGMANT